MGKIEELNRWIEECDEKIDFFEVVSQDEDSSRMIEAIIQRIMGIYASEIKGFEKGLEKYDPLFVHEKPEEYLLDDLKKVKEMLINYRDNLEWENDTRKIMEELEELRNKMSSIHVNTNVNTKIENNIDIVISSDDTIKLIKDLPSKVVSDTDKEQIEDKICGIETARAAGDKEKTKQKVYGILKFLADKGTDVLIAVLPYLGEIVRGM